MKLRKYTEQQLRSAVVTSCSLRQVLIHLRVAPYGGNYDVLRKAIRHFRLDTSHFTGQAWNRGRTLPPRRPLRSYLSNEVPIQSFKLRNRLLKERVLVHKCSICGRKCWQGQRIPLELDHINGNNRDNRRSNLRLLCPNCHALTPTYRSRKRTGA